MLSYYFKLQMWSNIFQFGEVGWVRIQWENILRCDVIYHIILHCSGEAEKVTLNRETRKPVFSCQFCFWFAGITSLGLSLLICRLTALSVFVNSVCLPHLHQAQNVCTNANSWAHLAQLNQNLAVWPWICVCNAFHC